MKVLGIIPARYDSTRFPGKPLALIGTKSMIQRVYEQCKKANSLQDVIVATDNELIFNHVLDFGGKAIMTHSNHISGTDRCGEVISKLEAKYDIVINIQGDEPFIQPNQIDRLVEEMTKSNAPIGTLIKLIDKEEDWRNPNMVKAVKGEDNFALLFSRSPIPYNRKLNGAFDPVSSHFKHLGIYGYTSLALREICLLKASKLEIIESLEQLRWLSNGYKIITCETDHESLAVDTPEDLEKINSKLQELE